MNERELLTYAARAYGWIAIFSYSGEEFDAKTDYCWIEDGTQPIGTPWNPLNNQNQAKRLADHLKLTSEEEGDEWMLSIVKQAAEIGEKMKETKRSALRDVF